MNEKRTCEYAFVHATVLVYAAAIATVLIATLCKPTPIYAYDSPSVAANAVNGYMYTDTADVVFAAKAATPGLYTHYKCVYTNASGASACIEDNVTKHGQNECRADESGQNIVYITKQYDMEGIYDIDFFCTDLNGTASEMLSVSIAVDSSAPGIIFENVENGKLYKNSLDIGITVREMFYDLVTVDIDASVTEDGELSKLVMPFDMRSSANKNIYSFKESGLYRIKVKAVDTNGHCAVKDISFSIDKSPPGIEIKNDGVVIDGQSIASGKADFYINVKDELSSAKAEIVLARKDGNVYTKINSYKDTQKCVTIPGEGFYMLKVIAEDAVGNKAERALEITLDKTPPVIGYISDFNEKYLNVFKLPDNFKVYIKDLTDTVYTSYLNSKVIEDGETVKKDGKYLLQVVCTDSANNTKEEMIAFIIDNTPPKVVVSGLNSDGRVNDGMIKLSLLDSDDYFESAVINGESINFDKDRRELNIQTDAYESYEICVTAKDFAGNETIETIKAKNAFGAFNPYSSRKDVKTLKKNNLKKFGILSPISSGAGFWIFCAFSFIAAVIFIVFALFDIKNITC